MCRNTKRVGSLRVWSRESKAKSEFLFLTHDSRLSDSRLLTPDFNL
jgi:hypothetical protein